MFSWRNCYVGYLNMDHRGDRLLSINTQLQKLGIPYCRHRGGRPNEFDRDDPKLQVQWNRTPGSIPCMMGQLEIILTAYDKNKSAMVFEDDSVLCYDIKDRLDHIQHFVNKGMDWDVIWLGGGIHIPKPAWRTGNNPDLPGEPAGVDAEPTSDPRMIKCYSAFSTWAYIVNIDSIVKVINLLESVMHLSMGIDWSFIKLGHQLNTFMYLPGCVKQLDNISDIAGGGIAVSRFSGFSKLGRHWYQELLTDFDPNTIQW